MKRYLKNKQVLEKCRIYQMLKTHATKRHFSFHTPGHKVGKWDITELSFSDNLSAPKGCILQAEQEISSLLRSEKSFILTDGSTSGVLAMLYTAKRLSVKKIVCAEATHKSFFNGCALLGLTPVLFPSVTMENVRFDSLYQTHKELFEQADAVFLTSPDYYGNVADLQNFGEFCKKENKLLLVDGAHGGHLRFDERLHASAFADLWVDGVHKSLPAFTQGAVVSAKTQKTSEILRSAVDVFRTTSPSYPIMASVEYAVKYPQNVPLEKAVAFWKAKFPDRIYKNQDWTKLCCLFGENAFEADKHLQNRGIYSEFCDGNVIMFYLSPVFDLQDFKRLTRVLEKLFAQFPFVENDGGRYGLNGEEIKNEPTMSELKNTEWISLDEAKGRICALNCGLFPPCTPLLQKGETISEEKLILLKKADNVFGIFEDKTCVFKEE